MWLRRIEADRLRNLRSIGVPLRPGMTLLAGRNGEGKTSLLEAVYLLATGRSFRTRRVEELVAWQGGPLRAAGQFEGRVGPGDLAVIVDAGRRSLIADGIERNLDGFLGRLPLVDLTSERMQVLRGGPEERRRFLDRGIVGHSPGYLRALGAYRRTLAHRNALLRTGGGRESRDIQLDAWDQRLVEAAREVHRKRREYAMLLATRLAPVQRALFPEGEEIRLRYRPSPRVAGESEAEVFSGVYADTLRHGRARDRSVGHTCRGPHRDDVVVELDGVDLGRYGSAGQVRAAMIALKLGKLSLLQDDRGEAPVFLMDDYDSDIDEVRAAALAGYLQHGGVQALVATSKERMAERLGVPFDRYVLADGRLRDA